MKNILVFNKVIIYKILLSPLFCLPIYLLVYFTQKSNTKGIDFFVTMTFQNINVDSIKYIIPVLIWLVPHFIIFHILSMSVEQDMENTFIYVFTRSGIRTKWLVYKLISFMVYVFIYYVLQYITAILMYFFMTGSTLCTSINAILQSFILCLVFSYTIILSVNIISLKIPVIYGYCISMSVIILSIFIAGYSYNVKSQTVTGLLKVLPSSNFVFTWHDDLPDGFSTISAFHLRGFTVFDSILYFTLICTVLIIIGMHVIRRKDIL